MYKLGGRGGAGAAKRPPAPHGRGRGGASSVGGKGALPRGRGAAAAKPSGRDEAFRLESGGRPAFAAIIPLTPDLVDEIRRAEEAGGGARIKFNPNMFNSSENGNFSTSPAPSPEPGASIHSFPVGLDANNEVITPFDLNKEDSNKIEKVTPSRMSKGINRQASAPSSSVDDNTSEVQSFLISVLSENPKGMGLKALEKSVADAFPNASKKIESIIKNIAIYQAPGRYVLKQGLEIERSKRNSSEGGRSSDEKIEEDARSLKIDDPDIFEMIDIVGSPVTVPGDGKVNNDSDDKAGSSNESGSDSDSDSDSSDSGSDSGSQSRSAAESGSGSSSDSDSDASSNSKEGSDAFVEITSDDDKANTAHTKPADDLNLSCSPKDLTGLDVDDEQIDIGTNLDYRSTSPHIDLNNYNTDNVDAAYTVAASEVLDASNLNKLIEIPGDKSLTSTSMDPIRVDSDSNKMSLHGIPFDGPLRTYSGNLMVEEPGQSTKHHGSRRKSTSKDGSNHSLISSADKNAKTKLKRGSGNDKPVICKKAKVDITSADTAVAFTEQKRDLPLGKKSNDRVSKEIGSVGRDASQDSSPAMKGKPSASGDLQKIYQSPNVYIPTAYSERANENIEKSSSKKKANKMQKPCRRMDGNIGTGYSHGEDNRVNFDGSDDSSIRKRSRRDLVDDKMPRRSKDANVNVNTRTSKGNGSPDGIMAFHDSNENNGGPSNSQRDNVERSPHGKKLLQRELSDLELGEFRETSFENDNGRTRKQFERSSSSKSLDVKLTNVNSSYPSMNSRKGPPTSFHDKSKPSPQECVIGGHLKQEGIPRKAAGYDFDDNRPQQRGNVPESQHLPRADNSDSENVTFPDRSGEKKSKRETKMAHVVELENADKKKTNSRLPQNGSKNLVVPRTQKSISPSDNEESRNDSLIETDKGRKRKDSSSDEDDLFFSKYDKDEPELKGPIKNFSQYKDYVQECHEKYEVYCYLNSQLEKTKSEFLKVEEDLSISKERDKEQYYNIVERLRDMYRESVGRHKLMKKIFVLLHEELQAIKQRFNDFSMAYSNE